MMFTQSTITIIIIAIAALLLIAGLITIIQVTSAEAKEKRFREKSTRIRGEVETQVQQTRQRIKDEGISLQTPEGEGLDKVLKECDYLTRDGYRSTDKIEQLSQRIPELEQAAKNASGVN